MSRALADLLFRPRSIVVYGASSDPEKLSGRPLEYLQRFGYRGDLYAINSRRERVQGIPAYGDIEAIPGPIDLAVIVVPAESVVEAVTRCTNAGVGAAIVFASGFAETGGVGSVAQEEIGAIADRTGMRILGPNCLGTFSADHRAFATFSTAFDDESAEQRDSPIALVSQSGAVGTFTYRMMSGLGLGVRYFANTGNQVDINAAELLCALAEAPDVELLLGHIEAADDLEALERLARLARDRSKPLVLLKGGRTSAGARAVAAHTASLVGDEASFAAVVDRYGVVRVESMEALADAALAFASGRRAAGRRLTIVTQSGGAGALAVDTAVGAGLSVEPWRKDDRELVARYLPYFGSTANPIDVTGALINDPAILEATLRVTCENDDTDVLLVVLGNCDRAADDLIPMLEAAYASTAKPFFVTWAGGSGRPREALLAAGLPAYPDPCRAVDALSHVVHHSMRCAQGSFAR